MFCENKYYDLEYVYVVDNNLDFVVIFYDFELYGISFNDFKDVSGNSIGCMVENFVGNIINKIIIYYWDLVWDGEIVDLIFVV